MRGSRGLSNVSFRSAQRSGARGDHTAFLYHAIRPADGHCQRRQIGVYDESEELLERVEDIIFDRRPDATERMVVLRNR